MKPLMRTAFFYQVMVQNGWEINWLTGELKNPKE